MNEMGGKMRSQHKLLSCFALILAFIADAAEAEDAMGCRAEPEGIHAVEICESSYHILFSQPSKAVLLERTTYKQRVQRLIDEWKSENANRFERDLNRDIEIWLSIPEANPTAVATRIIVPGTPRDIMFKLPLDQEITHWSLLTVVTFDKKLFPDDYGFKVGELLLSRSDSCTEEKAESLVHEHGYDVVETTPSTILISVPPFDERKTMNQLKENGEFTSCFKEINVNQTFEWISWKVKAFTFPDIYR